jgi:hypothetical protein
MAKQCRFRTSFADETTHDCPKMAVKKGLCEEHLLVICDIPGCGAQAFQRLSFASSEKETRHVMSDRCGKHGIRPHRPKDTATDT